AGTDCCAASVRLPDARAVAAGFRVHTCLNLSFRTESSGDRVEYRDTGSLLSAGRPKPAGHRPALDDRQGCCDAVHEPSKTVDLTRDRIWPFSMVEWPRHGLSQRARREIIGV